MQELSNQEHIDRGTRAQELLTNDVFQQAFKDLIDFYLNAFINSRPEDEKVREAAYYQAQGLQQITGLLNQWVAVKEQIIAQLEDSVEE